MLFCRLELKTSTDSACSYDIGSGYAPAKLYILAKFTLVTLVVGVWAEASQPCLQHKTLEHCRQKGACNVGKAT